MYKYGFIGMGNMGCAVLKGLLKIKPAKEIFFSSANGEKMKKIAEETGIIPAAAGEAGAINARERNRNVAANSEILILAVKPQVLPEVCGDIRDVLTPGHIVVSLAAGISLERISEMLSAKGGAAVNENKDNDEACGKYNSGKGIKLVRVMPNTPAAIGEGMTAISFADCPEQPFCEEEKDSVREIFSACGDIAEVTEKQLDVIGVTAGSSPAFTYMYIDALADAGVKFGLRRDEAQRIAAKAVMGAAAMVLDTGEHPEILKNKVCSPGGTTIEGVEALYEWGLKNAVMKACTACMNKNERLSG